MIVVVVPVVVVNQSISLEPSWSQVGPRKTGGSDPPDWGLPGLPGPLPPQDSPRSSSWPKLEPSWSPVGSRKTGGSDPPDFWGLPGLPEAPQCPVDVWLILVDSCRFWLILVDYV